MEMSDAQVAGWLSPIYLIKSCSAADSATLLICWVMWSMSEIPANFSGQSLHSLISA